jgi:hypothetical protein
MEEAAWIEMPPGMARSLAISLVEMAAEAERGDGAQKVCG